jgi:hypothetical protein
MLSWIADFAWLPQMGFTVILVVFMGFLKTLELKPSTIPLHLINTFE